MNSSHDEILKVAGLSVSFETHGGTVHAVRDLDLHLHRSEVLALLGESGSGKSVTARAIMGLVRGQSATVTVDHLSLDGQDLTTLDEDAMRDLRGRRISLVFQDALSALNPVHTIGRQLGEVLRIHDGLSRKQARTAAIDLLKLVGISAPERRVDDHPHQFSGGMRQRILIAIAIAMRPDVLIADEPTTALDVTVQAQILELLDDLRAELGMAVLLITHDLGVVSQVADRVAVMYNGRIVETSDVGVALSRPAHPYTEALLRSIPTLHNSPDDVTPITGAPPNPLAVVQGCAFHPRCTRALDRCASDRPPLADVAEGRRAACFVSQEMLAHG